MVGGYWDKDIALKTNPMPNHPFKELSMDFITGLPVTENNNQPVDTIFIIIN